MTLEQVAVALELRSLVALENGEQPVASAFVGDVLSHAMGRAPEGALWLTLQVHMNVVAVARLRNFAAVVFVEGRQPADAVIERARQEQVSLFTSDRTAFELAGLLWERGLR